MGIAIATADHVRLSGRQSDYFRQKTARCLDEYFFKILAACNVTDFLECGAYDASTSRRFLRAGGHKAVAVEANPHTYAAKTRFAQEQGVITVNCGLGREVAEMEFFVPKSDRQAGNGSFLRKPGEAVDSVRVAVDTIDNIVRGHIEPRGVIGLWVDVEGLALEVLKGGASVLQSKACAALKVEVETRKFWQGQALVGEVHDYLSRRGYTAVLRDIDYEHQFNLVYVQRELVDGVEEILMHFWRDLASLELDWVDRFRALRDRIAIVKQRLTTSQTSRLSMLVHQCAAFFGSKSSSEFLRDAKSRSRSERVTRA
jgi:FkbM family methyltransferase